MLYKINRVHLAKQKCVLLQNLVWYLAWCLMTLINLVSHIFWRPDWQCRTVWVMRVVVWCRLLSYGQPRLQGLFAVQVQVLRLPVAQAPLFHRQTYNTGFPAIPHVSFQQPKDTMRLDETMLVKQLLPEICHFIHTYREGNQHAAELRNSASGVLFSLSCNNFNAVFSRISTRWVIFSTLT